MTEVASRRRSCLLCSSSGLGGALGEDSKPEVSSTVEGEPASAAGINVVKTAGDTTSRCAAPVLGFERLETCKTLRGSLQRC